MKKFVIIIAVITGGLLLSSCRGKRSTGRFYMPDMAYSRAYETYAALDSSKFTNDPTQADGKIYYDRMPVPGTVARGEMPEFPLAMDKMGDTVNYVAAGNIPNPLAPLNSADSIEAARLYLVNCGICHGDKLDGNGPLYNGGNGPFAAAPKNLVGDPVVSKMPDGRMFYVTTYGIRSMGSYASQLTSKQRWMIVHFVKGRQTAANKPAATQAADSSAIAKK